MSDHASRESARRDEVVGALPGRAPVDDHSLADLRRSLAPLGELVERSSLRELKVDQYLLNDALRCPASVATSPEPFRWSTLYAARGLALDAMGDLLEGHLDLHAAITGRIADATAEGHSLGLWLATLSPAALGAVGAAAHSWAARAWLALPWQALGRVRFTPRATWFRPLRRSNAVALVGRPDATVLVGEERAPERVLVRIGTHDAPAVALDALVATFERGRAPLRVVTVSPVSGEVTRTDVDADLLAAAARLVMQAVTATCDRHDDRATGPHCRWCARRGDCGEGASWIGRHATIGRMPVAVSDAGEDAPIGP